MIKNQFLLLIFFLIIDFNCNAQNDPLKGNVKSIREKIEFLNDSIENYKLYASDGDYGHSGFMSQKKTQKRFWRNWYHSPWVHYINYYKVFNRKGLPKYETWYNKKDEPIRYYEYKYDRKSNLKSEKKVYPDGVFSSKKYKYNRQSNLLKEIIYYYSDTPQSTSRLALKYDSKNNLIISENHNDGQYYYSIKNVFDSANNKTKTYRHVNYKRIRNSKGQVKRIKDSLGTDYLLENNKYNKFGRVIESLKYNESDRENKSLFSYKQTFEYDDSNKLIVEKVFKNKSKDSISSLKKYFYNRKGLLKKEKYTNYRFSSSDFKKTYLHNKFSDIIQLIYTENKDTYHIEYVYEYDKFENWTKQTKIIDGVPLFVWNRKIEYFK